ncbi:MAG TPA: CHAD domain-containing protein [Vicinamibacterales bacterium]
MTRSTSSEMLVRQRLMALGRALSPARKGEVGGVHHARVATRRLREALPVIARGKTARKLKKRVRRLTRALGPVRELDVALMTLDELAASGDVPEGGILRLREVVGEERSRLLVEMTRQIGRLDLHKLQKKSIDAARQSAGKRGGRGDRRRIADADARAGRRGADLRAAINNAGGIYLADRLHAVRIAVKKLRYAMEIARELRASRAVVQLRTLKRVQDLLGRMHDLEVLIARTRAVQSTANVRDLKLSGDLDRLVRVLEMECRQLHVRYMNERKSLLAICDHVAAQAEQVRVSAA